MHKLILLALLSMAAEAGAASNQAIFPWDTPQPKVAPSTMITEGGGGAAKWLAVETSDRYTLYVDSNNVRKDGKIVELQIIYDLKTIEEAAGKPFKSVSGTAEYDCGQRQMRTMRANASAGPMGGSVRQNSVNRIAEPGRWMPVVTGTAQDIFWNYACAK